MTGNEILVRVREVFDREVEAANGKVRERFIAAGYSAEEVDAIIEANEPNMRSAWAELHRRVTVDNLLTETEHG